MTLVSVYIVSHNYGRYLEKCIISLINSVKGHEEFIELALIDDNSMDNSVEIIEKYRVHFDHVIINHSNRGLIKSSNRIIKKLKGDYIVRVDADDYVEDNFISEFISIGEKKNYDLVYPDYYLVDESGKRIAHYERSHHSHIPKFNRPFHGAFTFIRRTFLEDINWYDEHFSRQDGYYLWLRAVIEKKSVYHLKAPLFNYRQHRVSLSSDRRNLLDTRYDINNKYLSSLVVQGEIPFIIPLENDDIISERISLVIALKQTNLKMICLAPEEVVHNFGERLIENGVNINIRNERQNHTYIQDVIEYVNDNNLLDFVILEPDYPLINPKTVTDIVLTAKLHNYDICNSVYAELGTFFLQRELSMVRLNRTKNKMEEVREIYRMAGGLKYFRNCSIYSDYIINGNECFSIGHIEVDKLATLRYSDLINIKHSANA